MFQCIRNEIMKDMTNLLSIYRYRRESPLHIGGDPKPLWNGKPTRFFGDAIDEVFGTNGFAQQKPGGDDYAPLVREIIRFFQTGIPPVAAEETLELFAFMEAADESKRQGGRPVKISEVLEKAKR